VGGKELLKTKEEIMGLIDCASGQSTWYCYEYYKSKKVVSYKQTAESKYEGTVRGTNIYQVKIDIDHPRRSACHCPFAKDKELVSMIENGKKTVLGIEFGSTRIKAVLVDENNIPLASGSHDWENRHVGHIWTYTLEDIREGLQSAYAALKADVKEKYGVTLTKIGAIGISAMMHGYMAFDHDGNLLAPFRTWRNNTAEKAADELTALFGYHIPARWTIAHLYQSVLDGEAHVKDISYLTTLAGYVHNLLTGKKVVGIGEASGIFPIDISTKQYDSGMLAKFYRLTEIKAENILPEVLLAGENAGMLTETGSKLLDPEGDLQAGIPLCPPEGDAGTGMVATNAIKSRTGNVSAGTSVFAMIVLEGELKKIHPEIDLVTTPVGDLVGMVHCNNCTSDLNAWVSLFGEFASLLGVEKKGGELYDLLYNKALEGEKDCGGLLAYNYVSNEHVTQVEHGRPLFVRKADANLNLANFMRTHLYSAFGALKVGCDILLDAEGVKLDRITGHGGIFKTEGVAQRILAAALNSPVTVLNTAGEGGAWGMAILANYLLHNEKPLEEYLETEVFAGQEGKTVNPDPADVEGFHEFIRKYKDGLPVVREAVKRIE